MSGVRSMPKTRSEGSPAPEAARAAAPSLSPGIRRHLGQSLRTFYAGMLADPPGTRLEALIARLGKAKG